MVRQVDKLDLINQLEREYARTGDSNAMVRRRLAAVLSLLRNGNVASVSTQYGASPRTIQHWAHLAGERGVAALTAMRRRGRPLTLTNRQFDRLQTELTQSPQTFGWLQEHWSGALLSHHLASRYHVSLSKRRCRELINELKAHPRRVAILSDLTAQNPSPQKLKRVWYPLEAITLSDHELKARALKKIHRLAHSSLPLVSFAHALFELTAEAIPQAEHKTLILDQWFKRTLVVNYPSDSLTSLFRDLTVGPESESGFRLFPVIFGSSRPIIRFHEFQLSNYRKARMRNEVFVPLKVEDSLFVVLREGSEIIGYYPVDNAPSRRPFSHDDELFLRLAAPHIGTGVKTGLEIQYAARGTGQNAGADDSNSTSDSAMGVVLLRMDGRVLGIDGMARAIFQSIGAFDHLPVDAFAASNLKSAFAYIAGILRSVFLNTRGGPVDLGTPVAHIYSHRSGVALKLRGFLAGGESARCITVIVEQGETESARQKRLMYRYGLSIHELRVLDLLATRLRPNEISAQLHISRDTLKTYFRRMIDKLALSDKQQGLVKFAIEKIARSTSDVSGFVPAANLRFGRARLQTQSLPQLFLRTKS